MGACLLASWRLTAQVRKISQSEHARIMELLYAGDSPPSLDHPPQQVGKEDHVGDPKESALMWEAWVCF